MKVYRNSIVTHLSHETNDIVFKSVLSVNYQKIDNTTRMRTIESQMYTYKVNFNYVYQVYNQQCKIKENDCIMDHHHIRRNYWFMRFKRFVCVSWNTVFDRFCAIMSVRCTFFSLRWNIRGNIKIDNTGVSLFFKYITHLNIRTVRDVLKS